MALPRKGSRKIVVDGLVYRWYIRRKPTYCQSMGWSDLTVGVQQDETSHTTTLIIEMPFVRPDIVYNDSTKSIGFVSPADIARCIQDALKKGWRPDRSGSPFLIHG